ncbi:MAG TPA: signal recognition particle-docking protein FtsY [Firmicutes bacterium]|nr:signal recognition particle-docking protein FtsY [Bacillota bacterium]
MGFFNKLVSGLTKTRDNLVNQIKSVLSGKKISEELFEELEEILIVADVGVASTMEIMDNVRERCKTEKAKDGEDVEKILKEEIRDLLGDKEELVPPNTKPWVIMVVGVNGVGKTTTIGKLAAKFSNEGKKVVLAAGDTFRAAAAEQLEIWAKRADAQLISQKEGSDPAAVAYDAIQAAKSRKADVLIIDTAGRLHTKSNLMDELKKMYRVVNREMPDAPHDVLLVIDATTGQNGLSQAKVFKEATEVNGIALTKLDGTAKGGIVVAIKSELGIPVKLIGVGEGIDDLQTFDPDQFIDALFGE